MVNPFSEFMNINFNFTCTKNWIEGDVPLQIWEAISADSNGSLFNVRLLHNKPLFYATNYLRCYFSYLSPDFVARTFTILGVILYLAGLYGLARNNKKLFLAVLFLTPLLPLFLSPDRQTLSGLVLYAGILFVICYGIIFLWKSLKKSFHK